MTEASLPRTPPVNAIFWSLREQWVNQGEGRRYCDLAEVLTRYLQIKVSPQKLSQWSTGSDNRRPPWAAIYWLMQETEFDVKLTPEGARLQRRNAPEEL